MKIRITKEGYLMRGCVAMYCPYQQIHNLADGACGDWCPHFPAKSQVKKSPWVSLTLCGNIEFRLDEQDFIDERSDV